ncbi:unnamed protein product [Anisakis simplex]|uniref:G_PROTEIN_RECEP_F1_2 domain-containing protein n=1 Tax=Anisakis simplex TaxID=6269 RepID=A0A0M3JR33_ANISI|nr:unnamed protein product [Anisakis simplex]
MVNDTAFETTQENMGAIDIGTLTYYASTLITIESAAALIINLYILNVSKDPVLQGGSKRKNRSSNRRLFVTLILLAGSAVFGVVIYALNLPIHSARITLKLVAHTFGAHSFLQPMFHSIERLSTDDSSYFLSSYQCRNGKDEEMPKEFVRYLNDTIEQKSKRIKRNEGVKCSFASRSFSTHRPKSVCNTTESETTKEFEESRKPLISRPQMGR